MNKKDQGGFSPPAVGGASLLVVFGVLCLTVFALLSLTTVRADERLSQASAQAVEEYYAADCAAQEILARLLNGEEPDGVGFWGMEALHADYTCPISEGLELSVSVVLYDDGTCDVARWQAVPVGDWDADEGLELWDGLPF
ncbi:MAG: hypothetical protein HFF17_01765 [Oscillospiraceae bacterium]|nr:hypothetical protein [Oscillospiraceae bacterium]